MTFDAGTLAGTTRSRIAACAAAAAGLLLGYLVLARTHSFQLTAGVVVVLLLGVAVLSVPDLGFRAAWRPVGGLTAASATGYLLLGLVEVLQVRANSRDLWEVESGSFTQSLLLRLVLPAALFALAAIALLRAGAGPLVPARRGGPVLALAGAAAGAVAVSVIQVSESLEREVPGGTVGSEVAVALLAAAALSVAAAIVCRIPVTELLTLLAGTVLLSAVGLLLVLMALSRTVEVVGLRGLIPAAAAAVVALVAAAVVRRSARALR